jgi:hypothetical protein
MAENSDGMVATEEMLAEAARAGDLESLTAWAMQGVRVMTAEPLFWAARGRHLEVLQYLVRKLGADVNQTWNGAAPLLRAAYECHNAALVNCLVRLGADVNQVSYCPCIQEEGRTALHTAAHVGFFNNVRCLIEAGARIGAVDSNNETALLESARDGHYATMQYLLEEAGANMADVNNDKETAWDLLILHLEEIADDDSDDDEEEYDHSALTGLLRVMVLRSAPPLTLVALLSLEPTCVVQEGARLLARLPAYLVRRRALLDAHCSVLLPPLQALVHSYMELTTTEELWATGLGTVP